MPITPKIMPKIMPTMSEQPSNANQVNVNQVNVEQSGSEQIEIEQANLNELSQALSETVFEDFSAGYYIGMMSGTSLDGMDAVIVSFNTSNTNTSNTNTTGDDNSTPVALIASHSKDFPAELKAALLALCQPNGTQTLAYSFAKTNCHTPAIPADGIELMSELDWFGWASRAYGEFASEMVAEILEKSGVQADSVLAIGCHGQTVRHRPQHGFTLQLVDPNIIAERTGISVVTDFRRRDMAVGGQGAPLVPAFHQTIFAKHDETRILLNLGGIGNITVLPKTTNSDEMAVIGYDTGPANLLMDAWASLHTDDAYDDNGSFARFGAVNKVLLEQLLAHPFFALPAPKSTGREDFHLTWLDEQMAEFAHRHPTVRLSPADVQATLTELTAVSACREIIKYEKSGSLFVCGGGAYNGYLLERLADLLPDWSVATTDKLGLAPTWVEAVAFAWLARQSLMGDAGNLPAVTGADKTVVLGQVCFG